MQSPPSTSAPIRRVAILAPMPSELRPLLRPLGLVRDRDSAARLLRGTIGRVEVVAARTGIGMQAAARRAAEVLEAASPDHLLVVGIAGGIGETVAVGDLVVPALVSNRDTGETFRPAPFGSRPQRGTLASSDTILEAPADAERLRQQGVIAIDMETASIAAECERRGCPWSVFRAVSDRADDGTTDAEILALADAQGNPRPLAAARLVLTRPRRLPQLVRLARGARAATRTAAAAAVAALASL